ncbi:MAG TPA: tripartite tricarboxylate transporter substrate binding protein [Burkholderiaceae bacterium]|nr:tripartite tricarboxylate transporter substrate binding protein [Burkholderiaceae bacterium]
MNSRNLLKSFLATAGLVLASNAAFAQAFPTKTITIVVPFPPGGLTDQVARTVAQKLQTSLGKPVVVDNRPGGGGQIAAAALLKADADGHTLLVGDTGALAINQGLYRKFSYDPLKDFTPITTLVSSPLVLVVPKESPANSVQDLVALSKKKGSGLSFASQGVGTVGHLLGEMFRTQSGATLTHVAYKGSAPALNDVLGGHVDLLFDPVVTASPYVAGGKMKALGIAAPAKSSALPEVRPLKELGAPNIEASVWFGMVARAGTPAPVVAKLNQAVVAALKSPDVTKTFTDQGLEVLPKTADEFGAFMKSEVARWAPIVKASGATVD